jgi:hypothetical protein
MERYDAYLYTLPRLTEDKQGVIPTEPTKTQQFATLDEARSFAASNASKFERVVVIKTTDAGQELVVRFTDGKPENPPPAKPST